MVHHSIPVFKASSLPHRFLEPDSTNKQWLQSRFANRQSSIGREFTVKILFNDSNVSVNYTFILIEEANQQVKCFYCDRYCDQFPLKETMMAQSMFQMIKKYTCTF